MNNYQHISPEERASIQIKLEDQCSFRKIARHIGRSPSTVSREIKRQKHAQEYNATVAGVAYRERRICSVWPRKLREGQSIFDRASTLLECRQWSPKQISERLKLEHPDDASWRVSHETVYSTFNAYPRHELKKLSIAQLRQAMPKRGVRRAAKATAAVKAPEGQTIHACPAELETRETPGHWEGDLIVGAMNLSCVGTVVERTTGFVLLCKMNSKGAENVRVGFERQMKKIDSF